MSEPARTEGRRDVESAESADPETPVSVESIAIERAPGFERNGFTVEGFSRGVNVVYGENAAGKTTLSKAIRWSLWPGEAPSSATVRTALEYDGDQRTVVLRGGVAEHLRDGASTDPVPVPSLGAGRRYSLSLHDMLQEDTDDGEFATVIQRESTGGFDVDAVREEVGLEAGANPSTRNLAATREAAGAIERLQKRRRQRPDLEAETRELARIGARFQEAENARERVDLLETALSFSEAKEEYEEARAELESFPDELAAFDGDESDRLEDLDERVRRQKANEQEAARTHRVAAETLAATALSERGVPDGDLTTLREQQQRLSDAEQARDRVQRELSKANEERESIREDLPLDLDEETLQRLETNDLAELRSFVEMVTEVNGTRRVESAVREWFTGESEDGPERSELERGRDALENWLAAPPDRENDGEQRRQTGVRVAVAAALLAAVAGGVIGAALDPLGFLVTLLGFGLATYAVLAAGGDDAKSPRATHAETFQQTGLDAPATWEADPVRERLSRIRHQLAELELDARETEKRRELLARYDPGELEEELETARTRLRERFDTDVERDVDLAVTVERVERWQAADEEVRGKRRELSTATDQIDDHGDDFVAALEPYVTDGYDYEAETAADAAGVIESLEGRQRDFERGRERLDDVRGAVTEARDELDRLTSQREELFTDRGLAPGDRDLLAESCERLSDYEDAVQATDEAKTTFQDTREALRDHPLYDEEIEHRSEADLRTELRDTRATAEAYDDLLREKTEREREIADAKQSTKIAAAVQERDEALADLEAELAEDVADAVADTLLEFVEGETVAGNQEPVFRRADELLRLVTGGQFELRLEDGTFRAYDTGEGRRVDLNDLSSGTRVQVLLAVRVAFVEYRERETAPPLLLDETLAPFDDRRAETVLDTVIDLARQGRQVFYFTARSDERERWKRRLEDSGVAYSLQKLTVENDHDPVAEPPTLDAPDSVAVPEPGGDDHEAYRQTLDVPTFDPRRGAAAAHLWYVTADPDVLYRLRTAGLERWGHLRSLLEIGAVDGLLAEEARERVRRHGDALETFVDAFTVGRGKPVGRDVLEASGAVSERFIDEASELATRVDGAPEAVLEGLSTEVTHFREQKIDDLRNYLRTEGYVDPTPTRPHEQVRSEVIDSYCRSGLDPEVAAEAATGLLRRISAAPDPEPSTD